MLNATCDRCGKPIDVVRAKYHRYEYDIDGIAVKLFTNDNDLCRTCITEIVCNGEETPMSARSHLFEEHRVRTKKGKEEEKHEGGET